MEKKTSAWTQMVEETTVLTKRDLRRLFPEATILVEKSFGFPKSYIAYFAGRRSKVVSASIGSLQECIRCRPCLGCEVADAS